jgi:hypothetical protein
MITLLATGPYWHLPARPITWQKLPGIGAEEFSGAVAETSGLRLLVGDGGIDDGGNERELGGRGLEKNEPSVMSDGSPTGKDADRSMSCLIPSVKSVILTTV